MLKKVRAKTFILILFLFILINACSSIGRGNKLFDVWRWFILLENSPDTGLQDTKIVSQFDMAILKPNLSFQYDTLKAQLVLIASVGIGEVSEGFPWFEEVKHNSWLLEENPDKPGSYYLDVRNRDWFKFIISEIIPRLVSKGFSGILLDGLAGPLILEEEDPEKYKGSKEALVYLIHRIHDYFPEMYLISNNAFEILKEIAPFLDGVLVESSELFRTKKRGRIAFLEKLQRSYSLPVFVLEYTSSKSQEKRTHLDASIRKSGFRPYVANKELDKIYVQ